MVDAKDIKRMAVNEFLELGVLQEVNRLLLHPMGLAIEVIVDDKDDSVVFGGVWDYREDPEGMIFGDDISESDEWDKKIARVSDLFERKRKEREKIFGWHIQPIKSKESEE